ILWLGTAFANAGRRPHFQCLQRHEPELAGTIRRHRIGHRAATTVFLRRQSGSRCAFHRHGCELGGDDLWMAPPNLHRDGTEADVGAILQRRKPEQWLRRCFRARAMSRLGKTLGVVLALLAGGYFLVYAYRALA